MTSDPRRDARYIGIDGGASKTHVVVLDAAGQAVGEMIGPAISLNGHGDKAWAIIERLLADIDALDARDRLAWHVVVGIAGTEIEPARDRFIDSAPGFAALDVRSDAHIACLGAHAGADGAIVSIGTGVIGFACSDGHTKRVGGWGFSHDDHGSGAWLGQAAVSHALCVADGRAAPDRLAGEILAHFDDDPGVLSAWACSARGGDFARLAPRVIDAAEQDTPAAVALLDQAAEHIEAIAGALVGAQADLALALTGGLAPVIGPRLASSWQARCIVPQATPAAGAAFLAHQTAGTASHG